MGRPKKNEHERKDASIPAIRVTTAERVHIENMAATTGQSLSDFVRDCALYAQVKSQEEKPEVFLKAAQPKQVLEASLLTELNRIGVNLNQIARAANVGRTTEQLLEAAISDLAQKMQKLDEALT